MSILKFIHICLLLLLCIAVSAITVIDADFIGRYAAYLKPLFLSLNGAVAVFLLTYVFNLRNVQRWAGVNYARALGNIKFLWLSNLGLTLALGATVYYLAYFKWVEFTANKYPVVVNVSSEQGMEWQDVGEATAKAPLRVKLRAGSYYVNAVEKDSPISQVQTFNVPFGLSTQHSLCPLN